MRNVIKREFLSNFQKNKYTSSNNYSNSLTFIPFINECFLFKLEHFHRFHQLIFWEKHHDYLIFHHNLIQKSLQWKWELIDSDPFYYFKESYKKDPLINLIPMEEGLQDLNPLINLIEREELRVLRKIFMFVSNFLFLLFFAFIIIAYFFIDKNIEIYSLAVIFTISSLSFVMVCIEKKKAF